MSQHATRFDFIVHLVEHPEDFTMCPYCGQQTLYDVPIAIECEHCRATFDLIRCLDCLGSGVQIGKDTPPDAPCEHCAGKGFVDHE